MASAKGMFTIPPDALGFFAVGATSETTGENVLSTPAHNHNGEGARETWTSLIEGQLAAWARDPTQLQEEDYTAPTTETIAQASSVASALRDQGAPPPSRVVPTGDGGIAFQFERGHEFISIEI